VLADEDKEIALQFVADEQAARRRDLLWRRKHRLQLIVLMVLLLLISIAAITICVVLGLWGSAAAQILPAICSAYLVVSNYRALRRDRARG